jgi:hypothetical protein
MVGHNTLYHVRSPGGYLLENCLDGNVWSRTSIAGSKHFPISILREGFRDPSTYARSLLCVGFALVGWVGLCIILAAPGGYLLENCLDGNVWSRTSIAGSERFPISFLREGFVDPSTYARSLLWAGFALVGWVDA